MILPLLFHFSLAAMIAVFCFVVKRLQILKKSYGWLVSAIRFIMYLNRMLSASGSVLSLNGMGSMRLDVSEPVEPPQT